jgi:hypothetical protein
MVAFGSQDDREAVVDGPQEPVVLRSLGDSAQQFLQNDAGIPRCSSL